MSLNPVEIVPFEEMKRLANSNDVLIIDVREPHEVENTGLIGASINIPFNELEKALRTLSDYDFQDRYGKPKPDEDFPIIFTCKLGARSAKAYDIANHLGYNNARYYKGSWKEWEEKIKEGESCGAGGKMEVKRSRSQIRKEKKLKDIRPERSTRSLGRREAQDSDEEEEVIKTNQTLAKVIDSQEDNKEKRNLKRTRSKGKPKD